MGRWQSFSSLVYFIWKPALPSQLFLSKEDNEKTGSRTSLRALCKCKGQWLWEATGKMGECDEWKYLILVAIMK